MITKTDLIKFLTEAQNTEEKAIPIYEKHLHAAINWTQLNDKQCEAVKASLKQMAEESQKHKKIVEALIKQVKEDKRDAF